MYEIIKIYDKKGHTVLRKRVLEHLGVKEGDLLIAELKYKGMVILRPLNMDDFLAKLNNVENEDLVLAEKVKISFEAR